MFNCKQSPLLRSVCVLLYFSSVVILLLCVLCMFFMFGCRSWRNKLLIINKCGNYTNYLQSTFPSALWKRSYSGRRHVQRIRDILFNGLYKFSLLTYLGFSVLKWISFLHSLGNKTLTERSHIYTAVHHKSSAWLCMRPICLALDVQS